MNIIIINKDDYIDDNHVRLKDRRFIHMLNVLKVKQGQKLRIGEKQGQIGYGTVKSFTEEHIELKISLNEEPVKAVDINVIVALPRPPVIRRVLFNIAALGVKNLHFIHANRVEKSYWQSSSLEQADMEMQLQLGLEQAIDTVFPSVTFHKKFKPFVEDVLPELSKGTKKIFAHPNLTSSNEVISAPATIIIGPEGGFIDYEIDKILDKGFLPYSLGPRIMRVETALTALIAKAA